MNPHDSPADSEGCFHLVRRPDRRAAVINAQTGAWLGGEEEQIHILFKYLSAGGHSRASSMDLPAHLAELVLQSGIADQPAEVSNFQPSLAVVHLGHACNLSCEYCYAPKSSEEMSDQTIEATARFLANIESDLLIQFMGGEPILYRQQIASLIAALQRKRKSATSYGIQTNGLLLLNDGVLDFLQEHQIHFSVSFDGPQGMSRARYGERTPQFEMQVIEIIRHLHARGIDCGLLGVISRYNVERLTEFVDWCIEEGISWLLLNPLLPQIGRRDVAVPAAEVAEGLRRLFRYWVDQGLYLQIEIENFRALEDNLTDLNRPYMCRKYPCGAGADQIAVNTNGDIYPCDYLTGLPEFALGNVLSCTVSDIESSPVLSRLRKATARQHLGDCRRCAFLSICGHCIGSSHFGGEGVAGKRFSCEADRTIIEELLFELLANPEYSNHVVSR